MKNIKKPVDKSDTCVEVHFPKLGRGVRLVLIGTAHVSNASVEEVKAVITKYSTLPRKLAAIFLELDKKRLRAIEDRSFRDINIREILRTGQGYFFTAYLILSLFQRKVAEETGSEPGGEFKAAIHLAQERKISLELIDRPADITLRRAWRKMTIWQQLKFLLGGWGLSLGSLSEGASKEEAVTPELVENLKNQDKITEMITELEKPFPVLKTVVIDERDRYMAEKIYQNLKTLAKRGKNFCTVAVVGAGHMRGMLRYWKAAPKMSASQSYQVAVEHPKVAGNFFNELENTPPPQLFWKILKFVLPLMIVGLFVWGFYRSDWAALKQAFLAWILSNGILSALGALIARAHPFTVLIAFLSAPLTSLNPTIGAGLVAAWFEAYIKSPSVKDLETVQLGLSSFRSWWSNQFTKIILVFIFVSLGSALGTWVALPFLFQLFS